MGGGLPETVSLVLSVLSGDVCVAFSFDASIFYGGWLWEFNVSDETPKYFTALN